MQPLGFRDIRASRGDERAGPSILTTPLDLTDEEKVALADLLKRIIEADH
jgi:hypothetical protein